MKRGRLVGEKRDVPGNELEPGLCILENAIKEVAAESISPLRNHTEKTK